MKNGIALAIVSTLIFVFVSCGQENKGTIETSDIHGMVHIYGKKKYNTFSRKWKFGEEATWLLLKNGWALKNPNVPPTEINFEKSKTENPKLWKEWKGNKEMEEATLFPPSPKDARYELSVKLPSVSGTPGSNSVSTNRLKLFKNGKFETSVFSLTGIEGGGSSTSIGVSKDKKGTKGAYGNTTQTGTGTVGSSGTSSKKGEGNMSGTYYIDGHTIELRFDNGTVVRKIFATDGKETVILGTKFYFE